MATYIVLGSWTNDGARAAKDTVARSEKARELIRGLGGEMQQLYWTMGRYDLVAIVEAPDDETASAISVGIASTGMVRIETMRAFSADEVTSLLRKLG